MQELEENSPEENQAPGKGTGTVLMGLHVNKTFSILYYGTVQKTGLTLEKQTHLLFRSIYFKNNLCLS